MPELSEGDIRKVVTKRGEVMSVHGIVDGDVPLKEPVRVRVDEPEEAECLVALAEGGGFEFKFCDKNSLSWAHSLKLVPHNKEIEYSGHHDLTFESDYAQIKAWLEYHGESEDDECEEVAYCDVCGWHGTETEVFDELHWCPNCGEPSDPGSGRQEVTWVFPSELPDFCTDDFSGPRPEDEEWRQKVEDKINVCAGFSDPQEKLGVKDSGELIEVLLDYIREQESELENVREEKEEWQSHFYMMKADMAELEERIEEAREAINLGIDETRKDEPHLDTIRGHFAEAGDILSPDSDEGDSPPK